MQSPRLSPRALRPIAVACVVAALVLLTLSLGATSASAEEDGAAASSATTSKKARASQPCQVFRQTRRALLEGGPRSSASRATLRRMAQAKRACRKSRQARSRRRKTLKRKTSTKPVSQTAPSAPAGFRWGINANTLGRRSAGPAEQDRVKATGVTWLREEFASAPDADSDFVYTQAAQRGLRILPLLQVDSTLPSDVGAYADMVAAHVRRYGAGGEFWTAHPELNGGLAATHFEIYNEPYGEWYGPVEPSRYAQVLRTAVTRARQVGIPAKFLMAVDRTPGGVRNTWIDDLYRAVPDLNNYFDAVAIHPYSGNRAPDQAADPWGFQRIEEAHAALVGHGAGAKPFWITELGWSTCTDDPDWCVSEAQQAAYMERAARMVQDRYGFVEALFWYHLRLNETDSANPEHFFGLLHNDLTPKPAFHALKRITGAAA